MDEYTPVLTTSQDSLSLLPRDSGCQEDVLSHSPDNSPVSSASCTTQASSKSRTSSKRQALDHLQRGMQDVRQVGSIREWSWELGSWMLATCCLSITLFILGWFRGKPLISWTWSVSMNAVLAALSQTTQSALLVSLASCIGQLKWDWYKTQRDVADIERFDDASRGPQGSFKLLYHQWFIRGSLHLVSLGALATVLVIAFNPFTQQALGLDIERTHILDNDATITQYLNYTAVSVIAGSFNWGRFSGAGMAPLMEGILCAGIESGMVNQDTDLSSLLANCRTGNCTFEPYTTLGICSNSEDATSLINPPTNCSYSPATVLGETHGMSRSCDIRIVPEINDTGSAAFRTKRPMRELPDNDGATVWIGHDYDGSGKLDVYVIYEDVPWTPVGSIKNKSWAAVKGTLQPCALTPQTMVVNGRTNTSVLATQFLNTASCAIISDQSFCATTEFTNFMKVLAGYFDGKISIWPCGDNYFYTRYAYHLFMDIYGPEVYDWDHSSTMQLFTPTHPIPGLQGFASRLKVGGLVSVVLQAGLEKVMAVVVFVELDLWVHVEPCGLIQEIEAACHHGACDYESKSHSGTSVP